MVIRDSNFQSGPIPAATRPLTFTANPVDRLAAQIFDIMIVLLPVFLLLSAPFKTRLYHGFLVEDQEEILLSSIANSVIVLLTFIVYNAAGSYWFGRTLGKRLFHLKVVDVWTGERLGMWRSLGRAAVSAFSFLSCGLAFLPILSNDRRRALSDLCFDSEVVSDRATTVQIPKQNERWLVRTIFAGTALASLATVVVLCQSAFRSSETQDDLSTWFMDRASHCEAIDEAVTDWPHDSSQKPNRLQISMAMYAAGLVDRKCLQSEADTEASFSSTPDSLYYLAQSFVHADDTDVSDAYLAHVCQRGPNSSSCELSRIVSAWSSEDWASMEAAFEKMQKPDAAATIWAIRHFMRRGEPERAFTWIQKISPNKSLATFLQIERVKALWLMDHQAEAKMGALQSLESLPADWQVDLAAWMCIQETSVRCVTAESQSCQWLRTQSTDSADQDPQLAVALLRVSECSGKQELDLSEVDQLNSSRAWHKLVRAIGHFRQGEKDVGIKAIREIVGNKDVDEAIRAEAYRRYIGAVDNGDLRRLTLNSGQISKSLWREIQPRIAKELADRKLPTVEATLVKAGKDSSDSRRPASTDEP